MSEVKVIALGGVGEIGKNCSLVEQGDDIVVVDCGLSFPNEEMLGVDIVVPDFTYLIENKERVKGVFLTHAHEDHVGGLSYLLKSIDVPVYCTEFTHALIKHKMEERLPGKKIDFKITRAGEKVKAGELEVEFIRVTHSIPENCSLAIKTIHGHVLFTGDFKFDFTPVDNKLSDLKRFGELGEEGVVLLLSDSTNVERTGWGPSESLVAEGLRKVFAEAKGRVLLTTFASNIHRMQQAFNMAYETGRKVAVVGRSMERNLEICMRLGYLRIPDYTMISLQDAKSLPDHEVVLLTTGSQGEPLSALVQMSKGEYGRMQIREGDTLIYSARPIPGNEGAIWRTINRLFQQGCAAGMGYPDHRRFTLEAGIPLVMDDKKAYLGEAVATGRVLVDNSGTPGVTDEVLRDRYNVANDGLIIISIAVDTTHGEIVGDLNLMAKGFHGPVGILDQAKDVLIDLLSSMNPSDIKDLNKVKTESADLVRKFLGKRIKLRPLIVPSVIEV